MKHVEHSEANGGKFNVVKTEGDGICKKIADKISNISVSGNGVLIE
ncbi:hypothetical protein QEG73_14655 [Chitinophagaceae bacterium 26-R-25]|nr:hypothetical protein [Chitinophagaceae bacterium 26-R-25]